MALRFETNEPFTVTNTEEEKKRKTRAVREANPVEMGWYISNPMESISEEQGKVVLIYNMKMFGGTPEEAEAEARLEYVKNGIDLNNLYGEEQEQGQRHPR